MALNLEIEQSNGIILHYHRITSLHIITNQKNIIEVTSYTSETQREKEKKYYKEAYDNANNTAYILPDLDVYTNTTFIECPYDSTMNVERAYEYVKSLDEWQGATYIANKIDDGIYEINKKDDSELSLGDYLNPILYIGQNVEIGKWYYIDGENYGKDLPKECIKEGTPRDFFDNEYLE